MDYNAIVKTLQDNSDKDFVKRILTPEQYPVMNLGDGNIATHKMAWANNDDGAIVYPTIFHSNGKLKAYSSKDAITNAMKTGEFIKFNTPEEAEYFSKNYKQYWDVNGQIQKMIEATNK